VDNKQGGRPDSRWEIICLDGQMVDTFGQHNGGHRIRHYGLFASGSRIDNIARARQLLAAPQPRQPDQDAPTANGEPKMLSQPCPCCGGRMIVIETFCRGTTLRYRPSAQTPVIRIDTS
jgi:hypothetical protein